MKQTISPPFRERVFAQKYKIQFLENQAYFVNNLKILEQMFDKGREVCYDKGDRKGHTI